MWAMGKKRNKRCIPKEGMPHAQKACLKKERIGHMKVQVFKKKRVGHMKVQVFKKRKKKRDSPCPKKNGERWFMKRSSYIIHQKY